MTQQHDSESKSRELTERAKPASVGMVRKLRERVDELEKRLAALEGHRHGPRGHIYNPSAAITDNGNLT